MVYDVRAQRVLRSTRTAKLIGSALGVTLGCLIGMLPLLFMPDAEVVEAVKRNEKVSTCIQVPLPRLPPPPSMVIQRKDKKFPLRGEVKDMTVASDVSISLMRHKATWDGYG